MHPQEPGSQEVIASVLITGEEVLAERSSEGYLNRRGTCFAAISNMQCARDGRWGNA